MDTSINKDILSLDNGYSSFNSDIDKVFEINGKIDVMLKKEFKMKIVYIVLASLMDNERNVSTGYRELSSNVKLYSGNMLNIPTETMKRLVLELQDKQLIKLIYKAKHRGEKSIYKVC